MLKSNVLVRDLYGLENVSIYSRQKFNNNSIFLTTQNLNDVT